MEDFLLQLSDDTAVLDLWVSFSEAQRALLEHVLCSLIQPTVSHFNTGLRVKLQPTGSQSFTAGQVRERFALGDPKLTLFTDIWVHGKRITSSEILSKWTSVGLGLHSDTHRKLICLDLRRCVRWKKVELTESAGRFGMGSSKLARKLTAFPVMGPSFQPPLWPCFLLPLWKQTKQNDSFRKQEAVGCKMIKDKETKYFKK